MYRYLAILSVLILSLSACGSNETPQVQHDASLSKALTTASVSAAKESTLSTGCPIANTEGNVSAEECATMAATGCPKAGTADCPKVTEPCCATAADIAGELTLEQQAGVSTEIDEVVPSSPTTSILTLSLENEFGAVFVPHSQHVEMYSCDVCHPTTPPGKIQKTKKEFHALCRKCHTDEKAGPTKCRDCHQR